MKCVYCHPELNPNYAQLGNEAQRVRLKHNKCSNSAPKLKEGEKDENIQREYRA